MNTIIKATLVANDPTGQPVPVLEPTDQRSVLATRLLEIGTRYAALPVLDSRSSDEIISYDKHGLPS